MIKKIAVPDREHCAACGICQEVCPRGAVSIWRGSYAVVDSKLCVGCGQCSRSCPASAIRMEVCQ